MIRSLLNLQFNYSNGSLYDEHLNYRHIAKYASKQIDRNQILMKQILEILNENESIVIKINAEKHSRHH